MKKSFLKFSSTFLLLTTIGMTGTNAANVWGAEEGTKVIVEDTKMDTIGKRTAIFEGPKGLPCTSTMLTSNFGITAAHCGNGFQEGSVGTVYPAQSGLSTPFGSMSITLFNPYENKDVAFVYGPDNGKSRDYIYYQKEFASTEITLEGLSDEELYQLVGKKVYSFGYPYNYHAHKQYRFTGEITFANSDFIKTNLPAYGGQSGSSVFLEDNDQLVGILVKGGDDDKNAILEPITKDIARWYKGKKDILENPVQ
ncbi:TPA: glutamyl endopeptidase [Staphylococcus pseudintermedius]|uniref:trypsin-like serine peptidase n=1 Tax=Staphylococcus pseudintermedius TaxID=283734 RepID=UPI00089DD3B0|nr:glutamyl endopeptidase [Staphylococcus pseudintermedius]EGQ2761420.1 glutamyl endopeptidase [Staphylococcus pseudintermedius]EGQ3735228.1 glutamyl endopeptidase [Staphylococcus pseudintermedius]EKI4598605.1 glutamyl endopeptidase [Staphylococcus pseudintermedius]ELD8162601.1 glutamyl endopeptidase [Staphylococcus pseudintermedius]TRN39499.1 glutamyl endopeptidase [Staphylococcus pseudintermedius]